MDPKSEEVLMKKFYWTCLSLLFVASTIHAAKLMPTPDEAWERLKDGNQRFASGKRNCSINYMIELEKAKQSQTPYAAILSCSDSRLPPELIFDESLGKLFVMRVAGNIASDVTIGSIEYAVEILKVPIVVVLGHDSCGVLVGGLKGQQAFLPPFVNDLLNEVSRSVAESKQESNDFSIELPMAIARNAELQLQELLEKSQVLKKAAESNRTLFKAGIFHFDGHIEWRPSSE
jgi:carbonic anhydrase